MNFDLSVSQCAPVTVQRCPQTLLTKMPGKWAPKKAVSSIISRYFSIDVHLQGAHFPKTHIFCCVLWVFFSLKKCLSENSVESGHLGGARIIIHTISTQSISISNRIMSKNRKRKATNTPDDQSITGSGELSSHTPSSTRAKSGSLTHLTGLERALELIDKRTTTGTKNGYKSSMNKMLRWLFVKYPACVNKVGSELSLNIHAMQDDYVLEFFGYFEFMDADGIIGENPTRCAASTMNGMLSAFVDHYKKNNYEISSKLREELSGLLKGYKRVIADDKDDGVRPQFEGKRAVSFDGFKSLGLYSLIRPVKSLLTLFTHAYIILAWVLFLRGHSPAKIRYSNFALAGDSITIQTIKGSFIIYHLQYYEI